MRLETAEIDRYGPLRDCRPACDDGVTVISGPNEAGKTLYLEAVLQLLEPDVADLMNPDPRVDADPTGRVVLEHAGERFEFPGDGPLSSVSEIDPSHLRSVFVVRDNDLELPDHRDYYTSLIEKLGDIHTTEINAIKDELKDRGRLTDRRWNISSDQSVNNAGNVRDSAASLAEEIRDYVEVIEDEDLDELEARRLRTKRELTRAREKREALGKQRAVAEYERLLQRLETYRSTSERIDELAAFERETLEELRRLEAEIESHRDQLEEVEAELTDKREALAETETTLEEYRTELSRLDRREDDVEAARRDLDSYREREDQARGAEERRDVGKFATLAGLIGAGVSGAAGAVVGSIPAFAVAGLLFLAALVGALVYRRSNRRLTAVETAEETVLETARDAGLEVQAIEDVAPAIESFNDDLEEVRDSETRTDERVETLEARIDELHDESDELEAKIARNQECVEELLEEGDVESISAFEERVDEREDLKQKRREARQSLVDRFGEPDPDDPDEKAAEWDDQLEDLVADIPLPEVDGDAFDESALEQATAEVDDLEGTLEELEAALDDHDARLEKFDREAGRLQTEPFIGAGLELSAHTRDGLEALADDLERVVDEIETDAELSRRALDVFNEIESQEEEKLTDLFDPSGPASNTFSALTGDRYTEVAYDPNRHRLEVERHDGQVFAPETLSHGTRDQLYFATRVSLAQQLLGNDPGFLLLDDPFLAADPERLVNGFESLLELADQGWQILYCTAKSEVYEKMVGEFDLVHREIDPL